MFKDLPGCRWITEKQYEIINDVEGSFIEDSNWVLKVFPGVRIAMSCLIMGMPGPTSEFGEVIHKCPQCRTLNAGATLEKGFVMWYVHLT